MDGLHSALHESQVEVVFTKVDGTQRTMLCSLNEGFLPALTSPAVEETKRAPNPNTTCVFDLEKKEWRSFRNDSVISWKVL